MKYQGVVYDRLNKDNVRVTQWKNNLKEAHESAERLAKKWLKDRNGIYVIDEDDYIY